MNRQEFEYVSRLINWVKFFDGLEKQELMDLDVGGGLYEWISYRNSRKSEWDSSVEKWNDFQKRVGSDFKKLPKSVQNLDSIVNRVSNLEEKFEEISRHVRRLSDGYIRGEIQHSVLPVAPPPPPMPKKLTQEQRDLLSKQSSFNDVLNELQKKLKERIEKELAK